MPHSAQPNKPPRKQNCRAASMAPFLLESSVAALNLGFFVLVPFGRYLFVACLKKVMHHLATGTQELLWQSGTFMVGGDLPL